MDAIRRAYSIADAYMIEFAKDLRNSFLTDQADFAAFDADFGGTFADDWLTTINSAIGLDNDETVTDQLQQLTEAVEAAMKVCRKKYQATKYFIEKAFPGQASVWREFGFDDYGAARAKQPLLIEFMKTFFVKATKYTAELNAAGYDAANIADIQAVTTTLDDANQAQNAFKRSRGRLTQARITAYNGVWKLVSQVARVGKILFDEDPAKYNEYLLPTTEERRELLSLTGRVTDAATSEPVQEAEATIEELAITVQTDSEGAYGFGALPAGTYTLRVDKVGYVTLTVADVSVLEGELTQQDVSLVEAGG